MPTDKKAPRGKSKKTEEAATSPFYVRESQIHERITTAVKHLLSEHSPAIVSVRSNPDNEGKILLNFEVAVEALEDVSQGGKVKVSLKFEDKKKYRFSVEGTVDDPSQGNLFPGEDAPPLSAE